MSNHQEKSEWSQSHEILQWVNGEIPISWKTILYISYWSVAIKEGYDVIFLYNPNISNSTKETGGISEGGNAHTFPAESLFI